MQNAYAPYSNIKVGAAIQAKSGTIFTGCNIENASFGLTICAERVALFTAVCSGYQEFKRLAVVSTISGPVFPCGLCRQALSEFSNDMEIVLATPRLRVFKLSKLLPHKFCLPQKC
jgi:cytidine deaminase